jgi:queuine tRNA-ribosyltransferase
LNEKFRSDLSAVDKTCDCYSCRNYTKAYIAHLFRAEEMLAATLASIHNLHFIVHLVKRVRQSILEENFVQYKREFLASYYSM